MKVFHLLPSMQSGGVEQVVLELGKGLSEQGIENVVISDSGRLVDQLISEGSRHIKMNIGKKSPSTLLKIPALRKLFLEEKPDIIHLHSRVPAWAAYLAWKTLPKDKRPGLVSTVHGFYSINKWSAIMTKGQRVVAVSNCIKDYILRSYPDTSQDKIRVIPNAIDPELYNPNYRPSAEWINGLLVTYPELKGKWTICLPGRLTRLKGQLLIIPILKDLIEAGVPAHILLVGEAKKGKEAYKEEIVRRLEENGLSEHVTWLGHRTDLRKVLAACDVTISLSTSPESFGKTTLEALALGRPVAGFAHGGVAEQLHSFLPEGNIPVEDTTAMAKQLTDWYHNPPQIPQTIPSPYKMTDMIDAHIKVYQELLR